MQRPGRRGMLKALLLSLLVLAAAPWAAAAGQVAAPKRSVC